MIAYEFNNGKIVKLNKPTPSISSGEALIKILFSGICNTDIELFKGYYNFKGIAGHEFVGKVVNSSTKELIGKRVVGDINISCGKCEYCKSGMEKHCPNRKVLGISSWNGAFAEYIKLPEKNLHIVDNSIKDEEAVFTEPLAAALEPSQQYDFTYSKSILILGDGKLGLLGAMGMKFYSNNIVLVGKHKEKLKLVSTKGIKTVLLQNIEHELGKTLFDVIIEATGSETGFNTALKYIKPKGTIFLKTTIHKNININISKIVVDEIKIIGSRCGNFDQALYFLKNKIIDVIPLIQKIYMFNDFKKAFNEASKKGSLKILLKYNT